MFAKVRTSHLQHKEDSMLATVKGRREQFTSQRFSINDFPLPQSGSSTMGDMVTLRVPESFGYCVIMAAMSVFLLMWMGKQVGNLRKKTGIKYPAMYSDKNNLFNCYQRAHQNTLEFYPTFLCLLVLGGLYDGCMSSLAGGVWIASRIMYALGYYSGDPSKRLPGFMISLVALLFMMYCAVRAGASIAGIF
ncbi:Membrane-associated eicosanoid/glutathione metabolism (MAPEG) protein [Trinorchestia longiramus]|nr:Membrane-associated eicosanoid/glutathione metabolism (MAPEG) protein [Trinorchestia longiramus]